MGDLSHMHLFPQAQGRQCREGLASVGREAAVRLRYRSINIVPYLSPMSFRDIDFNLSYHLALWGGGGGGRGGVLWFPGWFCLVFGGVVWGLLFPFSFVFPPPLWPCRCGDLCPMSLLEDSHPVVCWSGALGRADSVLLDRPAYLSSL
jgi:hypothetical protein